MSLGGPTRLSSQLIRSANRAPDAIWAFSTSLNCDWYPGRRAYRTIDFATLSATGRPWSRSTIASAMSMPVEIPAEVQILPLTMKSASRSTDMSGNCAARFSQSAQCVVTRRPPNSPNSARTKVPVQTDPKRWLSLAHRLSHRRVAAGAMLSRIAASWPPDTSTVSTVLGDTDLVGSVAIETPQEVATRPPRDETILTS